MAKSEIGNKHLTTQDKSRYILAITGASGAIYASDIIAIHGFSYRTMKSICDLYLKKKNKIFTIPFQVIKDFRFLLERGYAPMQALDLIGKRFQLTTQQKHLLKRGVCSYRKAKNRRRKKQGLWRLRESLLGIDGHNVLITIESALKGKPLVFTDDGFIRDISGVSASYRPTWATKQALNLIFGILILYNPLQVDWYFDAPLSHSGKLANETQRMSESYGIKGQAQAVPVPENFLKFYGLIATSDSELIDTCMEVIDLAGEVLKFYSLPLSLYRF